MSKVERVHSHTQPDAAEPIDSAAQAIVSAIGTLLDGLSPAQKELVLRKVIEKLRPIPVPQAGDVLGIVVQLLPRDRQWTVSELKQNVEKQGVPVTAKEIHNALGYLTRKGHIRRLGYGKYIIGGIPVVTADDFGGEPSITEGDADD
jgi:hypothetical protein